MKFRGVVIGLLLRKGNSLKQQKALDFFLSLPGLLRTIPIHPQWFDPFTIPLTANQL